MLKPRLATWIAAVGLMMLGTCGVSGQDYPGKPVRIITSGAGGGSDFDSRQIAQGISGSLGQPVIVDNRANGILAAEAVPKAPPDGYTLLMTGGIFWTTPLLQKTAYDPVKDFAPISLTSSTPNVLVVHPSLPVKSLKELIALAKARPGELNYAANAAGSPSHLETELFKSMAGVNIVHVPYKGNTGKTTALIVGEVHMLFSDAGAVMPHVKAGKIRALAVTSPEPSALVPGLPTVAASGLPGYRSGGLTGLLAPAKTPGAIITRLNQEVVRFLNRSEVKEQFLNAGVEIVASSPEQFAATIKSAMATTSKVIKDVGIKAD